MTVTECDWPQEFCTVLDRDPEDFLTRLVLADWLSERGREDEAEGLRWSVGKGRIPFDKVHWGPGHWRRNWSPELDNYIPDPLGKVMVDIEGVINTFNVAENNASPCRALQHLVLGWFLCDDNGRAALWVWKVGEWSPHRDLERWKA